MIIAMFAAQGVGNVMKFDPQSLQTGYKPCYFSFSGQNCYL